jgi:putative resolvase
MDRLVKVKTAARVIGVHRKTVEKWCREGSIECLRTPGGEYRIPREIVERLRAKEEGENGASNAE